MNSRLHEMEIDSIAWEKFETQNGDASKVRAALIEKINAPVNEAEKSYWAIENHVVVQGELFSSAEPTLNVILAALAGGSLQRHTRIDLLELAFQIISAAVQKRDEHPQIYKQLQDRVIACANQGLWLFYSFFGDEHEEAAKEIVLLIDEVRATHYLGVHRN